MSAQGKMVVISGPSGAGKSTICRLILKDERVEFSISVTTRKMREGEKDGRDYYFLNPEEFSSRIATGAFIEHAHVHGNMYGTLRKPMDDALKAGRIYLLEIDVQGALQMKAQDIPGLYIFISPPSFDELRKRLVGRASETPEVLERRLQKAEDEYRERIRYDHIIVNDDLEQCVAEVKKLIGLDTVAGKESRTNS
ncbi:MAG: guanylate kinase [Candidatus Paceibacteria bacterium]|jgi:guanylate kinase